MGTRAPVSVAIPADVELEDTIVTGLTARQLVILGGACLGLYGLFTLTRTVLALWLFAALAAPIAAAAVGLALGRRDGISFDRWILAALTHWARTRPHPKPTTPGMAGVRRPLTPPRLPARDLGEAWGLGVVDLGSGGLGAVAVASTVSFALRTPGEQEALVATFARYLHSLSAPVQLLIRARPLDLSPQIQALDTAAGILAPPALAAAASEHADYLWQLGTGHQLLCRQIVLAFREPPPPGPGRAGDALIKADRAALIRLNRRLTEAAELLTPAGITITPLDADQARSVLHSACYPHGLAEANSPDDTADLDQPEQPQQSEQPAPSAADDPDHFHADEPADWADDPANHHDEPHEPEATWRDDYREHDGQPEDTTAADGRHDPHGVSAVHWSWRT